MPSTSRRRFLGLAGSTAVGVALSGGVVYRASDVLDRTADATAFDGVSSPRYAQLTPFTDQLRIPPTLRPSADGVTEIDMVAQTVRLHSMLPPVPMWTYAGHFPGPQIETTRGVPVRIAWKNSLPGKIPLKAVYAQPSGPAPGLDPYNTAGSNGAPVRSEIANLTAWTTAHLHGGHQHAIYDGMADSGITPGDVQYAVYPNVDAAHLFYHDHAMPVTAPNVLAGLQGSYFVRDPQEDRLGLPSGEFEVPLAISDINFETDAQGLLQGQILYKRIVVGQAAPGGLPPSIASLAPFTMVNGVVWPYQEVKARAYRFRILNFSLSRLYTLALLDEETGKPLTGAMQVIGTELGLLDKPRVVDETIALYPAERVDIVIDFARFAGRKLRLVNTTPGVPAGQALSAAALPHPEVMQFRVDTARQPASPLPQRLSPSFRQIGAKDVPANAVERFVALVVDAKGMPTIQELQEVSADKAPGDGIVQIALPGGTRTFEVVANVFEDRTTFFIEAGGWEKWTFINASGVAGLYHPMHIHLMNFQIVERYNLNGIVDPATQGTKSPITLGDAVPISPEESGWKDVVSVPGGTMAVVAGHFGTQTGRFMYHCHLLDHEDDGMMRPVVVMPAPVLAVQQKMMAGMGSMPM